jgi:hypothetical protein
MDDNEQTPEVQSPLQRDMIVASFGCFVSLIFFYLVARAAVALFEDWWIKLLAYAIIPLSVTFIILYRSCWHREIVGVARTLSLLLISCVILVGEFCAIGVMLSMLWFCFNAVYGGNH